MSNDINQIKKALEWRYAVKSFDPSKKIPADKWSVLEDSLVLSPSSYGLQPWKFLIVENKDLREKLKPFSWNQTQVTDASHLVVFTTLKEITPEYIKAFIQRNMEVRNVPHDAMAGYEGMMIKNIVEGMDKDYVRTWNQRQSYIAMGFLLETAALLEIDTVAMEGITPKAYDEILGLDKSPYATVSAVALGYRSNEDKYQFAKKVRFDKEKVIQKI
jgi:nitroreductase